MKLTLDCVQQEALVLMVITSGTYPQQQMQMLHMTQGKIQTMNYMYDFITRQFGLFQNVLLKR